jgi:hypothetical protein
MTAIIIPSYQTLVANAIIETLGPTGLNVMAWIEVPRGRGKEHIEAVFFGPANTYNPVTNGIICRLPNEELFGTDKISPYERWETESMDITFNLYLKQDIEASVFASATQMLEDNGQVMPEQIDYMTDAYKAVVRSLRDLKRNGVSVVKSLKSLTANERSNANGVMPAQRKCRIEFMPCIWQN